MCAQKRNCANCGSLLDPNHKHECFKPYCTICQQNTEIGHLCYMKPLSNELPRSDNVLFVFYDFETTQDTRFSDAATVHIPNLLCLQQFCSLCEMQSDITVDCARCGKRKHTFFDDHVGDLSYLCKPRQWCKRIVAIAHNVKGFNAQFILNTAIFPKWNPNLILNGLKITCMTIHNLTFLGSISFLPMALRKLPQAVGLSVTKSWYHHFYNTKANLNYVGPIPGIEQYGVAEMNESERKEFACWYDTQKDKVFDNRRVLEEYYQDDVTVLRQTCQIFRRDFIQVGNVDVFLESCTIASACSKVLRKLFLKPETIGLIPTGG